MPGQTVLNVLAASEFILWATQCSIHKNASPRAENSQMLSVIAKASMGNPEMISLECLESRVIGKLPTVASRES